MNKSLPGDGDGAVAGGEELVLVLGHWAEHSRVGSVTGGGPAREVRGTRGHPARSHPGGEQEVVAELRTSAGLLAAVSVAST